MDVSASGQAGDVDLEAILKSLGGGGGKTARPGVWFELGNDTADTEPFVSYLRYAPDELVFKEYNDKGAVKFGGHVWYTREGPRVEFKVEFNEDVNSTVEGWFAMAFEREMVDVYAPGWLVENDEQKQNLVKVLKGYCHLKKTELDPIDEGGGGLFGSVNQGLSGEMEAKQRFRVVEAGELTAN